MFQHLMKKPKVHDAVTNLIGFISDKGLKIGAKLPPIRDLSKLLDVSTYTVYCALNELKKSGIVDNAGKKVIFLKSIPPKIRQNPAGNTGKSRISLYFRDSFDIRKINSILLRHKINEMFMKAHKNIQIEEIQLNESLLSLEASVIKNLLLGKTEPTGWEITQASLPFYHQQKLIAPIRLKSTLDYCRKLRPECVEKASIDNELFMFPISRSFSFMIYNKDIFAKRGLDEKVFDNWKSFENGLEKLRTPANEAPFIINNGLETVFMLMHWIIQQGNYSPLETPPKINWLGREAEIAMKYFHRLAFEKNLLCMRELSMEDKIIGLLTNELPFTYVDGYVAGALLSSKNTEKFGIAFVPAPENRKKISLGNLRGSVVNIHAPSNETDPYLDYVREREEWIYLKDGSAQYRKFNKFPAPYSIFKNPSDDKFMSGIMPMPSGWLKKLAELEENIVWEPAGSGWEKILLGEIIDAIFKKDGMSDFQTMKNFFDRTYEIKYSDSIMQLFQGDKVYA